MTRKFLIGALAVIVMGLTAIPLLAQSQQLNGNNVVSSIGDQQQMTGTVTCASMINHQFTCRRNETPLTCTLRCVQHGSNYALKVGSESYLLRGDVTDFERFAGERVTVNGSLSGSSIQAVSVTKPGAMPEMLATQEHSTLSAGR